MKIGILGGTFDPVHRGHLLLAQAAKEQAQLDKVLFVPAFIPPHKTERRDMAPAPYRFRMVEIAIRNHPDFEISDAEFCRPDISYTVDTLRELKKKYESDELFLILGSDAAAEISKWREPEEIRKRAGLLVAGRPGRDIQVPEKFRAQHLRMEPCPISSSSLRKQLEQGRLENPEDLPEGVEEFVRKKKLYGGRPCPSS